MAGLWGGASGPDHDPPSVANLNEDEVRRAGAAYREILGQRRPDPARRARWEQVLTDEGWVEVEVEVLPAGEDS